MHENKTSFYFWVDWAEEQLKNPDFFDYGLLADVLKHFPEMEKYDLADLAYSLSKRPNVSKNDIKFLLEMIEIEERTRDYINLP